MSSAYRAHVAIIEISQLRASKGTRDTVIHRRNSHSTRIQTTQLSKQYKKLHVPQWKSQLHVFAHYAVHFGYLSDTLVDHDPEFRFSMRIYLAVWQFWPCKSRVLPGWQRLPRTQTGPQIPQWLSKPLSIALGCFLCPFLMHPLAHTRKSKHKINFLSEAKVFVHFAQGFRILSFVFVRVRTQKRCTQWNLRKVHFWWIRIFAQGCKAKKTLTIMNFLKSLTVQGPLRSFCAPIICREQFRSVPTNWADFSARQEGFLESTTHEEPCGVVHLHSENLKKHR